MHREQARNRTPGRTSSTESLGVQQLEPGKRTLTEGITVQLRAAAVGSGAEVAETGTAASAPSLRETAASNDARPTLQMLFGYRPVAASGPDQALPADGGGHPMPADVRAKMESAFGADFSQVRIHEGARAAALGASAYTQGPDIHFAPGAYRPHSSDGQELLAHELTHVVQQRDGRVQATTQAKGVGVNDDSALEREADEMGARAARGEPVGGPVQRLSIEENLDPAKTVQVMPTSSALQFSKRKKKKTKDSPKEKKTREEVQRSRGLNIGKDRLGYGKYVKRNPHGKGSPGKGGSTKEQTHSNGNRQAINSAKRKLIYREGFTKTDLQSSQTRNDNNKTTLEENRKRKDEEKQQENRLKGLRKQSTKQTKNTKERGKTEWSYEMEVYQNHLKQDQDQDKDSQQIVEDERPHRDDEGGCKPTTYHSDDSDDEDNNGNNGDDPVGMNDNNVIIVGGD